MSTELLKIKNLFTSTIRGFSKVFSWMVQGLRAAFVLSIVFYAVGMGWFVFYSDKVNLDDHTVLVMDLKGVLVEESPGGLRDKVIGGITGNASQFIRLRDVVMTLELAAKDKRIDQVLLKLDDF